MPRKFFFEPETHEIPPLHLLRSDWKNIPDIGARQAIAIEFQYLRFQAIVLKNVRHAQPGTIEGFPLGLSVRAGALKSAILLVGSIAEAALRAHAEKRGIKLSEVPEKRTFGHVLYAWKNDSKHFPSIQEIWDDLKTLHADRNNIHLYETIDKEDDFFEILRREEGIGRCIVKVLNFLRELESV